MSAASAPSPRWRDRWRPGFGPPPLRPILGLIAGVMAQAAVVAALVLADVPVESLDLWLAMALTLPQVAAYLLLWRALDGAPLAALGYLPGKSRAARGLVGGFAAGVLALGAVVLAGLALGGYRLAPAPLSLASLVQVPVLVGLLAAAHAEEVIARGWLLQDFGRGAPLRGLVLSALVFAALHGSNPHVLSGGAAPAVVLMVNIALAGVFLGTVFLGSGDLYLPTGLHLGWNWAQGALFGLPVSGIRLPSLLEGEIVEGRPLLTGTEFGPESSLLATAVLLALSAAGLVVVTRRGARGPLADWLLARRRDHVTSPDDPRPEEP